jgi:hypothetical protein
VQLEILLQFAARVEIGFAIRLRLHGLGHAFSLLRQAGCQALASTLGAAAGFAKGRNVSRRAPA